VTLHPQIAERIEKAAAFPPMHRLPVERVRRAIGRQLATGLPKEPVGSVEDRTVPGPAGPVPIRVYRPDDGSGRPLIVFFHGSGFVICDLDTHDDICRQLCARSGCVVVSVDYRLAPENPFPAGPDDCLAATRWAAANAADLGADPGRLALAGDSAGACMATVVAMRCRDAGGPTAKAQALVYPVTDHWSAGHPSYADRGVGFGMTAADMRWFWNHYCPDPAQGDDPHASPLRAPDLSGLPPAYVVTAEYDVLRDEGRDYAAALARAGVPVEAVHYDDMNHGFLHWVGVIDTATLAMERLAQWIRRTL